MTRNLENLAVIALVLWAISYFLDPAIVFLAMKCGRAESAAILTMLDVLPITVKSIVSELVRIGVGVWLYRQAKRDGTSRFVWALFGLAFSLTAVVLYLLVQLLDEIRGRGKADAASHGVDPIR